MDQGLEADILARRHASYFSPMRARTCHLPSLWPVIPVSPSVLPWELLSRLPSVLPSALPTTTKLPSELPSTLSSGLPLLFDHCLPTARKGPQTPGRDLRHPFLHQLLPAIVQQIQVTQEVNQATRKFSLPCPTRSVRALRSAAVQQVEIGPEILRALPLCLACQS